ncbi:MAG: hrcA [Rhodospirillales bacterium]|jgi:heat-inducible transcriptional repressor|nr:hrcA [Rhodospirillales bacterium]
MSLNQAAVGELSERSREILRTIVEAYVETGEPVGSRTISRKLGLTLSPATIRNVMADLEDSGLLYAPHTSAGRLPTDLGLRLFVHGLLEIGSLTQEERASIDGQCRAAGKSLAQVLEQATEMLSGLSHCAGLVVAPKVERPLKHIEFVQIGPGRALVVLVAEGGLVENRIIELPLGISVSALVEAGNYLTHRLVGRTLLDARQHILAELDASRAELDQLTGRLVEQGLAIWGGVQGGAVIVKGQSRLLEDVTALSDLERVRALLAALDARESMVKLLDATQGADGVQIYIGAENELFSLAGCSVVFAPYRDGREQVVGAIGVVGPTRMNYARIIPMVDYTAKVIGRIIG